MHVIDLIMTDSFIYLLIYFYLVILQHLMYAGCFQKIVCLYFTLPYNLLKTCIHISFNQQLMDRTKFFISFGCASKYRRTDLLLVLLHRNFNRKIARKTFFGVFFRSRKYKGNLN